MALQIRGLGWIPASTPRYRAVANVLVIAVAVDAVVIGPLTQLFLPFVAVRES